MQTKKLEVFDTVGKAFSFTTNNIIQLTVLLGLTFVGIMVPIAILASFAAATGEGTTGTGDNPFGAYDPLAGFGTSGFVIFVLLTMILIIVLFSVICTNIIEKITKDRSLMLPRITGATFRYMGAMAIMMGLALLLEIVIVLLAMSSTFTTDGDSLLPHAIGIPLAILLVIAVFGFFCRMMVFPVDAVVNGNISLSRTLAITSGNTWRLVGLYFAAYLLMMAIMMGIQLVIVVPVSFLTIGMSSDGGEAAALAFFSNPAISVPLGALAVVLVVGLYAFMLGMMTSIWPLAYLNILRPDSQTPDSAQAQISDADPASELAQTDNQTAITDNPHETPPQM